MNATKTRRAKSVNTQGAATPSPVSPVQHALDELQQLIDERLPTPAREHVPPDLPDTWRALHAEAQRLRAAFATPILAGRVVVALGGSFSAGKSSLINALLGTRLMPTDITPTTAVPAYAMRSNASRIQALGADGALREVSAAQLKNFTHNASDAAAVPSLRSLYAQQPDFIWSNLALLDTPGYSSPGGADAHMARTWLGSAHAIIWCVPADAGTIPASDLEFLATLDKKIPLAIAITKTDKKPAEDIGSIAAVVKEKLQEKGFTPQHIWRISTRRLDTLQNLKAWLETCNTTLPHAITHPIHAAALALIRNIRKYLCSTAESDAWNPHLEAELEQYSSTAARIARSVQNLENAICPASGALSPKHPALMDEIQTMQRAYEQARISAQHKREKLLAELERLKKHFRINS